MKNHWLVKSEPASYSWDAFVRDKGTAWTGVRNFTARINLRAMRPGDFVLFYHSVTDKAVVGIAKVTAAARPDPTATEGDWSCVDLKAGAALPKPVSLDAIKAHPALKKMLLVRQSRLSVCPLTEKEAAELLKLGGL